MTDHADLSRRLALAIGYARKDVRVRRVLAEPVCEVRRIFLDDLPYWRFFDYRDGFVAWRIAEHYDRFPQKNSGTHWFVTVGIKFFYGDTAAEAVARAVIGAHHD